MICLQNFDSDIQIMDRQDRLSKVMILPGFGLKQRLEWKKLVWNLRYNMTNYQTQPIQVKINSFVLNIIANIKICQITSNIVCQQFRYQIKQLGYFVLQVCPFNQLCLSFKISINIMRLMKSLLLFVILLICSTVCHIPMTRQLTKQLLEATLSIVQSQFTDSYFSSIQSLANLQSSPLCSACHTLFQSLKYIPTKQTVHLLERIATEYCVRRKMQDRSVCKGAVGEMTSYLISSAWKKYTDPHSICHKIRMCPKEYTILSADDYAKNILKDKPNKTQEEPTLRKVLNIMHISDLHPDFFYTAGMPVRCTEPICCRPGVIPKNNTEFSGYWGSNKGDCDLPFHTFNLFLEQISKKQIDAIIWTGDNTAHDIWRQSEQYNANFTMVIANQMRQKLPASVKIFPAMGNHESYPVNVYQFGNQPFLNSVLANAWSPWIGADATKMMRQKGYFSFRVDAYNLVVLSVNTQAWNDMNWVLLANPTDPGDMLKWMEQELKKAEQSGDKVYIIGHIPPNEAMVEWGWRYNALVDRFSYTIRGQFYGHTHNDHLAFFTGINDTKQRIINTYYVAPSLTTYSDKNPRYRIMKVDLDTMRVLDYDQFALKLQKNYTKEDRPQFEKTYSFLNQYNLPSMSFENLETFRAKLRSDNETQIKYTYHKRSELSPGSPSKTINCETYATTEMVKKCESGKYQKETFDKFAGPWRTLNH